MKQNIALLMVLPAALALVACGSNVSADNANSIASKDSIITVTRNGNITTYESAGNLKATNRLGCEPATEVPNTNSAADILIGAFACIQAERFDEAAELFMVSAAFAAFDKERVADITARGAFKALTIEVFGGLPEADGIRFQESVNTLLSGNVRTKAICEYLQNSELPTYFPQYMISHGLESFASEFSDESQEPLVEDFDSDAAWVRSLEYVNCNN